MVLCPSAEAGGCRGEARIVRVTGTGSRRKETLLGRATFTRINTGARRTLVVTLNRTGKKLMRSRRRLPIVVVLAARDDAGNLATVKPPATLRR
jgi:hypothetical protein